MDFEKIKKGLEKRGYANANVNGYSMYPILKDGQKVRVEVCPPEKLKPFDIIVFLSPDGTTLVCHFFVENQKRDAQLFLYTRRVHGQMDQDMPIPHQRYLGRVAKTISLYWRWRIVSTLGLRKFYNWISSSFYQKNS